MAVPGGSNNGSNRSTGLTLPTACPGAKKGMVASIGIHENSIQAKVKGSRPKPFPRIQPSPV